MGKDWGGLTARWANTRGGVGQRIYSRIAVVMCQTRPDSVREVLLVAGDDLNHGQLCSFRPASSSQYINLGGRAPMSVQEHK